MESVPIVFIAFKVIVLGVGMFFAIKWHYDQGKRKKGAEGQRAVVRSGVIVVASFLLLLVGLLVVTFSLGTMLGLDLTFP